jgi:ADP-ribose pyrophosphatase
MSYEVLGTDYKYSGDIVTVRVDRVREPDGSDADREVVEHVDAVAILALDDQQRVLLIRQYRQPSAQHLWELPAGLCDQPGEPPWATARRELAEETGFEAAHWSTLVDLRPSPGMSTEIVRVYQAGQLTQRERSGNAEGEEDDLQSKWLSLSDAVTEVLVGHITNGLAVAGLLAAAVRKGLLDDTTRPAEAAWPT